MPPPACMVVAASFSPSMMPERLSSIWPSTKQLMRVTWRSVPAPARIRPAGRNFQPCMALVNIFTSVSFAASARATRRRVSSIVRSTGVPSRSLKRYFMSQIVWATGGRSSSVSGSVAASMIASVCSVRLEEASLKLLGSGGFRSWKVRRAVVGIEARIGGVCRGLHLRGASGAKVLLDPPVRPVECVRAGVPVRVAAFAADLLSRFRRRGPRRHRDRCRRALWAMSLRRGRQPWSSNFLTCDLARRRSALKYFGAGRGRWDRNGVVACHCVLPRPSLTSSPRRLRTGPPLPVRSTRKTGTLRRSQVGRNPSGSVWSFPKRTVTAENFRGAQGRGLLGR